MSHNHSGNKTFVFLLNSARGLISHRLELACAMRDAGYVVHVIAPFYASSEEIFAQNGLHYHPLHMSRKSVNPLKELLAFLSIVRLLWVLKPHVLYLTTIKSVIYGGIAARICHVPAVIMTISGRGYVFMHRHLKARVLQWLCSYLYPIALSHRNCRVIFQNPDDRAFFITNKLVESEKTEIIFGAGVDIKKNIPAAIEPPLPVRVAMVARLLKDKGVCEYTEAARLIKESGHSIEFLLIGAIDPGNPSSLSEEALATIIREGYVTCLGECHDIPSLYQQSHIACLPSYAEGLPKALLEAAACGLPIITTDVPGCREVVEDGKNGILVPVQDASSLANAIMVLAEDSAMRRRMCLYSREKAEKEFSLERIISATLRVVKQLELAV
jgi:glycosyltransferase involved in cell wall biosynthesis